MPACRLMLLLALPAITTLGCETGEVPTHETVTLDGRTYKLELAVTDTQRANGLMGRKSLPADGGMLFIFPGPEHLSFWMKNCVMDIDVIYIDASGRVVSILEMKPPKPGTPESGLRRYPSGYPAQFAIEIAGGTAKDMAIKRGDKIDLRTDYLTTLAR